MNKGREPAGENDIVVVVVGVVMVVVAATFSLVATANEREVSFV